MSGVAVVTVVHGRHDHLRLQERSLGGGSHTRVVVAMDDPGVADLVSGTVVPLERRHGHLPLAAARNAGAEAALALGAQRLVFLDVDCLAEPGTVAAYAAPPADGRTVWCGPVTYLRREDAPYDVDALGPLHAPHPARPDPGPGRSLPEERWELFWSLSFALDAETWRRAGGFDEAYEGYGAEDTDFGQRLAATGARLEWLGDARAFHQWHPSATPPVHHRDDLVRNANLFHDRWGWWPMTGWLEDLRALGLVDLVEDRWRVCA